MPTNFVQVAGTTRAAWLATVRPAHARSPRVLHLHRAVADFGDLGEARLSEREREELAAWRNENRRRAWLLGRTLAKELIAELLAESPEEQARQSGQIEILSRDAEGRVNRPRIWCDGVERPWSLSISHCERGVLAALTATPHVALGVDLAGGETFSDSFVDLWFTPAERAWFHDTQCQGTARFIWAAKEAMYKAANDGESFVPRDVEVLADGRCTYRGAPLPDCRLRSWTLDDHLAVSATVRSSRNLNSISSHTKR